MSMFSRIRPASGFPWSVQAFSLGSSAFLLVLFLFSSISVEIKGLVLTGFWVLAWLPRPLLAALRWLFYRWGVVFYFPQELAHEHVEGGAGDRPMLALTIDDGPALEFDSRPAAKCSTSDIRRVLDRFNVKATWFVIGGHVVEDRKTLLQELVQEGHELANHGMLDRPAWLLNSKVFEDDVVATQDIIRDCGGGQRRWYRPGQAVFTRHMLRFLKENGYRIALGSVYPHDAVDLPPVQCPFPRTLAWLLVQKARAGDVIIVHDRPWTARVLELALPSLASRFEICTLSRLADVCESARDVTAWCEPREMPLLPAKDYSPVAGTAPPSHSSAVGMQDRHLTT
jgi:peptidoglycan/xylan/chitin deacetylase (PgdA/CDA1 family)